MASEMNLSSPGLGVATVPALLNVVNGDAYLIEQWDKRLFIGLIDGLGHGEEAAKVSTAAKEYLIENFKEDLPQIMRGLHVRLVKTRGAVAGLIRIDQSEKNFCFCGVGNIEVKVLSDPEMHPVSMGGIVGMSGIRVRKFEYRYNSLSSLALYSDGVSGRFELPGNECQPIEAQKLAQEILSGYWNKVDDATIIVAMWGKTHV